MLYLCYALGFFNSPWKGLATKGAALGRRAWRQGGARQRRHPRTFLQLWGCPRSPVKHSAWALRGAARQASKRTRPRLLTAQEAPRAAWGWRHLGAATPRLQLPHVPAHSFGLHTAWPRSDALGRQQPWVHRPPTLKTDSAWGALHSTGTVRPQSLAISVHERGNLTGACGQSETNQKPFDVRKGLPQPTLGTAANVAHAHAKPRHSASHGCDGT